MQTGRGALIHPTKPCRKGALRIARKLQSLVCRSQHQFIIYSKPDCPLCDGLKDKLQSLIDRAEFMPSFLTGSTLEVRDISTNQAWCDAHAGEIPVLAVLDSGSSGSGEEVVLPRPQPRIPADRLQRHLEEALREANQLSQ